MTDICMPGISGLELIEGISLPVITPAFFSSHEHYLPLSNIAYQCRCFVKETGQKFSHYLIDQRVKKAEELFQINLQLKIQDVAEQVGCGNTNTNMKQ